MHLDGVPVVENEHAVLKTKIGNAGFSVNDLSFTYIQIKPDFDAKTQKAACFLNRRLQRPHPATFLIGVTSAFGFSSFSAFGFTPLASRNLRTLRAA